MVNSTANEPTDHQTGNTKGLDVIHYSAPNRQVYKNNVTVRLTGNSSGRASWADRVRTVH
jgi:hypothetical protein